MPPGTILNVDGVRPGWGTRIPLDLLTAAVALGLFLGIQLVVEANFGGIGVVLAVVLGPAALAGVFTGWCMSLALRLKLGGWWRNTVVYVALRLLRRGGGEPSEREAHPIPHGTFFRYKEFSASGWMNVP